MPDSCLFVGHAVPIDQFRHFFDDTTEEWPNTWSDYSRFGLPDDIQSALEPKEAPQPTSGGSAETPPLVDLELRVFIPPADSEGEDEVLYLGLAVSEVYIQVALGDEATFSMADVEAHTEQLARYFESRPDLHQVLKLPESFSRSKIECRLIIAADEGESASTRIVAGSMYTLQKEGGHWQLPGFADDEVQAKLAVGLTEIDEVFDLVRQVSGQEVAAINQSYLARGISPPIMFVGDIVHEMYSYDLPHISAAIDIATFSTGRNLYHIIDPEGY